jgi:hypothetical protein
LERVKLRVFPGARGGAGIEKAARIAGFYLFSILRGSTKMRVFLNIIGIVCLPVGSVWILQGFNILVGSVMSGHRRWIVIGGLVLVLGVLILVFNNRRKRSGP